MAFTPEAHQTYRFRLVLIAVAAGVLAACTSFSTIETSHLADAGIKPDSINGVLYYLPIGRIHITGGQSGSNTKDTGSMTSSKSQTQSDPSTPSDSQQGAGQSGYTITVSADIEADPSHEYYLKPDRNYFYDDNTAITVGTNGLLTSGNATATDQTGAIIAAVASLIPTPASTVKAGPAQQANFKQLLALVNGKPGSYVLDPKLFPKIDAALSNDLKGKVVIPKTFSEDSTARKQTTVADLRNYLQGLGTSPDTDATQTYKVLSAYFLANPTIPELCASLNPPIFPDTYPVPQSLFSQVDSAITTQDNLKPTDDDKSYLSDTLPQKSSNILELKTFLTDYFPQNQPVPNALSVITKQLLAKQTTLKPFDLIFDPNDRAGVANVISTIKAATGIDVNCVPGNDPSADAPDKLKFDGNAPDVNGSAYVGGIAFRPGTAWVVTVKNKDQNLDRTQTLILPDKSTPLLIDYNRMPFVSKITNVQFSNGMLVSISSTFPSPILGFLGIPKSILQAVLPIPQSAATPSGTGSAKSAAK